MNDIPKTPLKLSLTTLLAIVLVVAILVVGGVYLYGRDQESTNQNNNTVLNQNANTGVNQNVNGGTSANQNANVAANNNSAVPDGWQTYTNEEYGYSFSYPSDWSQSYVYESNDSQASYEKPLHYSIVTSADETIRLLLGVERVNERGTTYYRTG